MRLSQFQVGMQVYAPNVPQGGFASRVVSIHPRENYLILDHHHSNGQPWRCYEINNHVRSRGDVVASKCLSRYYVYWGDEQSPATTQQTPVQAVSQAIASDTNEFKDFTSGVEIEMFAPDCMPITNNLTREFQEEGNRIHVGRDCSISGYPSGFSSIEIQTHILKKDRVEHDIRRICEIISEGQGDVNKSCGLHVHLGSRHLNNEQLLNVAKTFNALEPVIYAMQPKSRRKESDTRSYNYCKALKDNKICKYLDKLTMIEELVYQARLKSSRGVSTKIKKLLASFGIDATKQNAPQVFAKNYAILRKLQDFHPTVGEFNYASHRDSSNLKLNLFDKYQKALGYFTQTKNNRVVAKPSFKMDDLIQEQIKSDNQNVIQSFDRYKTRGKSGKDRYFGLNLTSHFYRGTIEFRYHSGSVKAQKILNWIQFLHYAMDFATNHFDKAQLAKVEQAETILEKIDVIATICNFPTALKTHCVERYNNFLTQEA